MTEAMREVSWQSGPLPWPLAARVWGAAIGINGSHFSSVWSAYAPTVEAPASFDAVAALEKRVHGLAQDLDCDWGGLIARPYLIGHGYDAGARERLGLAIGLDWRTSVTTRLRRVGDAWQVEIVGEHLERQAAAEAALGAALQGSLAQTPSVRELSFAVGAGCELGAKPRNRAEWLLLEARRLVGADAASAASAERLAEAVDVVQHLRWETLDQRYLNGRTFTPRELAVPLPEHITATIDAAVSGLALSAPEREFLGYVVRSARYARPLLWEGAVALVAGTSGRYEAVRDSWPARLEALKREQS
jgi:hypothetical protein